MTPELLLRGAVGLALVVPSLLVALLGAAMLLSLSWREATIGRLSRSAMLASFVSLLGAWGAYLVTDEPVHIISFGRWFSAGERGFDFDFRIDALSLGFATLASGICGVVSAFSYRYLHRETGFNRYFFLFSLFATGILLVALAGSIEVLFAGWEFLGLSSALLVGFFHDRPAPVRNALYIFAVYRVSDAAMLGAAVLLHHLAGSGSLSLLFSGTTPDAAHLPQGQVTLIALLLIAAVAGKSALLPFSSWLPRAMEGPTPSSAVYYGALSIHAGCFLLLRAGPLLEHSTLARVLVFTAGATTALYATLAGRVQSDVKSSLAFASMTQVGLIVVEISLGFYTIAFVHMAGHACFRLLQFLTAPNVMRDLRDLENALGPHEHSALRARHGWVSLLRDDTVYLIALERGFIDTVIDELVVRPFRLATTALDRFDRFLCALAEPRESPPDAVRGTSDD